MRGRSALACQGHVRAAGNAVAYSGNAAAAAGHVIVVIVVLLAEVVLLICSSKWHSNICLLHSKHDALYCMLHETETVAYWCCLHSTSCPNAPLDGNVIALLGFHSEVA